MNSIGHRNARQTVDQRRQGIVAFAIHLHDRTGQVADIGAHVAPAHARQLARRVENDQGGSVQHQLARQVRYVGPRLVHRQHTVGNGHLHPQDRAAERK